MTAFARTCSARSFLSPPFARSNALSRLASDLVIAPSVLCQREYEASLKPCLRHSALIGKPASASRKKQMICSSLNRFFLSNLRQLRHWTPNQIATQNQADVGQTSRH